VRTIVATEPTPTSAPATETAPATTTPAPTTTAATTGTGTTGTGATTTRAPTQSAPIEWPADRSAHTVVVASTTEPETATRLARAAIRAGLPDVGVLESSEYASLRPGYYVVFSGFYQTADDALAAVEAAQQNGYPRAYEREITP
jgi:hypothetical protein